jgi:hypothetical protein
MELQLYQKKLRIDDATEVSVAVIPLSNSVVLLVTDKAFRLGAIFMTMLPQTELKRDQPDSVSFFKVNPEDSFASKMIGGYFAKRLQRPVLSIIALHNQDPKVIKEITLLLEKLAKEYELP